MSHNVEHYTYPENVNKTEVQAELDHYAAMQDWQEGCQGLYHDIRWLWDKVYSSYEEAEKAIEKLDRGNYDQLAVRYTQYHEPQDDKSKELANKLFLAREELRKRDFAVYPQSVISAFIGCKKCGSKMARDYLRTNFCPVCKTDMRPEYIHKSIQAAKNKVERAQKELSEYAKKKGRKEIMWLVKIEYHT